MTSKCDRNAKDGHDFQVMPGFTNPICSRCGTHKRGRPPKAIANPALGSLIRGKIAERKALVSSIAEPQPKATRRYTVPLLHPRYCIEPCPNCEYPEADGGYCPECGWIGGSQGVTMFNG